MLREFYIFNSILYFISVCVCVYIYICIYCCLIHYLIPNVNIYLQVLKVFAIVRVIRSKDSKYTEGDVLLNEQGFVAEYSIVPSSDIIRKIDPANGISLLDYLGTLGSFSIFFL